MEAGSVIKDKKVLNKIKQYYEARGNTRDLLLFSLGINTGLKVNELLDLNVSDVRNKSEITLKVSNGVTKKYPLNAELQGLISTAIDTKPNNSPLFESAKGCRIERTTAYRNFKQVVQKMGLDSKITLSSLRKTFGYHYYCLHKDILFLQWLFNQKNIEETKNYIDVSEDMNEHFKVMEL